MGKNQVMAKEKKMECETILYDFKLQQSKYLCTWNMTEHNSFIVLIKNYRMRLQCIISSYRHKNTCPPSSTHPFSLFLTWHSQMMIFLLIIWEQFIWYIDLIRRARERDRERDLTSFNSCSNANFNCTDIYARHS